MSTLTVSHVHPALTGDDDVSVTKIEEVFLAINYPARSHSVSIHYIKQENSWFKFSFLSFFANDQTYSRLNNNH